MQRRRLVWLFTSFLPTLALASPMLFRETGSLPSSYATQAAAADERFVYAVSGDKVALYDRATAKLLGVSRGPAHHLNSGFVDGGKLYLAHSNYPDKPDESDIRVLDPATRALTVFHSFEHPPGSLTWAIRRGGDWWCLFARYGAENRQSVLIRFDPQWREVGRWHFAPELVADWGGYSLSGGVWMDDDLLATGHDKPIIYRLHVPASGELVRLRERIPSPFPGQGIAIDPVTGGLIGIDRQRKAVVFATRR